MLLSPHFRLCALENPDKYRNTASALLGGPICLQL